MVETFIAFFYNNARVMLVEELFKALSSKWRLKIIQMLEEREICQCEFLNFIPIDETTLSRHLSVLKRAGIVSERRKGRKKLLSIKNRKIYELLALAEKIWKEGRG